MRDLVPDRPLTSEDIAAVLSCSLRQAQRYMSEMPVYCCGRKARWVLPDDFVAWFERHRAEPGGGAATTVTRVAARPVGDVKPAAGGAPSSTTGPRARRRALHAAAS
jgi:hypothetical protein